MTKNTLYYGDNLDVLRLHVKDESVDLVYLDPPFNSKRDYNVLFKEQDGTRSAAQIKAFEDTWRWDEGASRQYRELVEAGGQVARAMECFRGLVGETDMLAYLTMMAPRLVELRRALKPTGSLYLHCDPSASHYLKMLLDTVFGSTFRNEIVWCYAGGGIPTKDFPRKHDTILRYSKTDDYKYSPVYRDYSPGTKQRGRTKVKGKYFDAGLRKEGTPVNDWWNDVPKITSPTDPERLGYPTQKSVALLERIVRVSTSEGDTVLDPFCGCGTAIAASERLGRRWIGIDITQLATSVIKSRLHERHGLDEDEDYEVIGEPTTLSDARILAKDDTHQFEHWALGLVKARASAKGKGADGGLDGWLGCYVGPDSLEQGRIIVSVKSGKNVGVGMVRDLGFVVEREKAVIGVLILMAEPTKPMRTEAAQAGDYVDGWGIQHPKLQILTVEQLLDPKSPARIDAPPTKRDAGKKGANTKAA